MTSPADAKAPADAKTDSGDSGKKKKRKNWLPLESNPDLMNKAIWQGGVSPMFRFTEVLGVDPDLLAMVPSVRTLCCLFCLLFGVVNAHTAPACVRCALLLSHQRGVRETSRRRSRQDRQRRPG